MKVIFNYGRKNDKGAEVQNINIRVIQGSVMDVRRSLGWEVSLKEWDFDKKFIIDPSKGSMPQDRRVYLQNVNDRLLDIRKVFNTEFLNLKLSNRLKSLSKEGWDEWCENTLNKALGIEVEDSEEAPFLLDKYRQYIDFKSRTWKPNTKRNNESAFKMLSAFMDFQKFCEYYEPKGKEKDKWEGWYLERYGKKKSKQYRTDETDMNFYRNLQDWNIEKGNGITGAFSDQIKHLKSMLKYFESIEGLKIHHNINHKEFKGFRNNPEHDILTKEELSKIFEYSGKSSLENVRDLIKVQYYACMRYSELKSELKKGVHNLDIHKTPDGYRWNILQGKVGERKGVPVHRLVMEMINNGTFPHIISDQKYREYIKELLAILHIEKQNSIGTHTIRRSFCTNMFNDNHSFQEISQYSGHKTESQLREYIQAKNVNIKNSIPTE